MPRKVHIATLTETTNWGAAQLSLQRILHYSFRLPSELGIMAPILHSRMLNWWRGFLGLLGQQAAGRGQSWGFGP